MGIRIKKILGYALTDIITHDGSITDERINTESPFFDWDVSIGSYREFLGSKQGFSVEMERHLIDGSDVSERDLRGVFHWDSEYGLPNVIVIQPLLLTKEWTRYGDTIDAEEYYLLHGPDAGAEPTVREISHSLYPYTTYMDRITGERTKDQVYLWKRLTKADPTADLLGEFSKVLGYRTHEEALDHIVPAVPEEVRFLVEWSELFRDSDAWKSLRPVMYTLFT